MIQGDTGMAMRKGLAAQCGAPAQGWTLTELLMVMAILGILAAVAIPGYQQQQRQARRSDAQTALLQLQLDQARYRSHNERFASETAALGWTSDRSSQGHYRLQIAQADSNGFVIEAHAVGTQRADTACNPMRLALQDAATVVLSSGADTSGDSARCWRP